MKEATGDLNMTVVVVLLVAVMVAFFSMVLWPTIKTGIKTSGSCSDAICPAKGKSCTAGKKCECSYKNKKTNKLTPIICPYKG